VSAAAKVLNVSQPTVSKVLRHAEDKLSFKLFDRQGGRLSPTDRGVKLFEKIEPLFERLNDLDRYTRLLAEERKGHLRFAMTPAFGLEVAPVAISAFSKKNPDVTMEAETRHAAQLVKAILDGEIDIGLVFDAPGSAGLQKQTIAQTNFVCVVPQNFPDLPKRSLQLTDLKDLPLITLNSKSVLGQVLNRKVRHSFQRPLTSHITVETYHLAKRLVKQNAGIAIIDAITAFSGDTSNLEFYALDEMAGINIDIIARLNEPRTKIQSDFVAELQNAILNCHKSAQLSG
jgi:DNA-binding transcriptional LysR family regulator